MSEVRTLDGKPAVLSGTIAEGEKIVVIAAGKLRLLTKREWKRLPPWRVPEPRDTSPKNDV